MKPDQPSRTPGPTAFLILASLIGLAAAAPPEVVKVRVPESRVRSFFPAGADLRVLTSARFDELLRAADQPTPTRPVPRLIRASHAARWDAGMLAGRSDLTADSGPGLLAIEPWSPAIADGSDGRKLARATDEGRLALRIEAGATAPIPLDWRLRARPGSEGRAFLLSLPVAEVASLTLDLPAGLVPETVGGPRFAPLAEPSPGRSGWRAEAARGRLAIRLHDRNPGPDGLASGSPLWLSGPTRVDLTDRAANWRAEWTLEEVVGRPRRLTVELDPGLDLIDVAGPMVASFRAEGPRVTVEIDGEAAGPSPITIRAACRVPTDGPWLVPSARPIDAIWTDGRTTVRLDDARVLQSCAERSGRRVAPRAGDPSGPSALAFEAGAMPGPVAELTFHRPTFDASGEVRGLLRIGPEIPTFEAALTWRVERGRVPAHAVDLSPGWTPDRLTTPDGQPVAWHAEPLPNGSTRVHMSPTGEVASGRQLALYLRASAPGAGISGPLDLPRVRHATASVRTSDEIWVATTDPTVAARPILGRGLAWIDPPPPSPPWGDQDPRGSLAWRWLADDAEARVDRSPASPGPTADVALVATVARGRLLLEWTLKVEAPGEDARSVAVRVADPADFPDRWVASEPGGPDVVSRPLPDDRGAAPGFPRGGATWAIEMSGPARDRAELKGRVDRDWSGSGNIPILILPARYQARGSIVLRVEDTTRVSLDATGLTRIEGIEGSEAAPEAPAGATGRGDVGLRTAATFGYRRGGGHLAVKTIPGRVEPTGGVVREALLTTQVFPGSGLLRHRLTLRVASESAVGLDLTMPAGATIDRVRRDGQAIAASPDRPSIRIPIPIPSPGRPSSIVTLDYRTPSDDLRSGRLAPARLLPAIPIPCASFVWEITAPAPWRIEVPAGGLVDTEPRPGAGRLSDLLGLHPVPRPGASSGPGDGQREAILVDFDRARGDGPAEETMGDWLVRLDSGRWPLVVDRLAFEAAGLGPMTRVEAAVPGAASRAAPSLVLQKLGLRVFGGPGVILIAGRAPEGNGPGEGPGSSAAWYSTLHDAAREGADVSDRFQSPARWRGEATPRALSTSPTTDRMVAPEGWKTRRLVAVGWPTAGTDLGLVDGDAEARRGWVVAAMALLAGVIARKRPARARAWGFGMAWMVGVIGVALAWPEPSPAAIGLLRGSLIVLAYWLGRSARDFLPNTPAGGSARPRAGGLIPIFAAIGATALAAAGTDAPIVAVLPYEGAPDIAAPSGRVMMLLDDYERLARLARPSPSPGPARASLTAIRHRVSRVESGPTAEVESRCEVAVDGEGPASWSIPVGPCLDLSATVDDRPASLAISGDGRTATLPVGGPGSHRVVFRRMAPILPFGDDGGRVNVPLNRAAFAEVEVSRDARAHWVEIPGAGGSVGVREGGAAGTLGPVDSLEVRWFARDRPPAAGPRGPVQAAMLWEARPSGDLARVRMIHSDPEGIATLGLALDPGVLVRSFTIPGAIAARSGDASGRAGWFVGIDPPLPKGVPIELTLWRPAATGSIDRRPPGFRVIGDPAVSGLLGFRRPSDWSGRLVARGDDEAQPEASFVRAWGTLPDDGLTLAGAIRFRGWPAPEVATAPVASRRTVRNAVLADLGAGRLEVTIDAELADRQGHSFAAELALPVDFRVLRVNADGLVDWLRVARDRVRLQFERSGNPARRIRIQGYLPVPADPVLAESRAYQCKLPWPRWIDAEAEPGELTLTGPGRFQLASGDGVVATSPLGLDEEGRSFRASYRVDRPEGLGMLRWSPPPARVGVSVSSDLTLDPSSATWTAVVDCEVSGGPVEALHWKIPTDWARGASLEVVGSPHRLDAREQGETTSWDILPDVPLWGRVRLILRSRRPLVSEAFLAYPEIIPLSSPGRGSVANYDVAIANVSGRAMEVAGSAGLQAIDPGRYRSRESPAPAGSIRRAYHVTGESWSLRLRVGRGEGDLRPGEDGDFAGVVRSRLWCGLANDGAIWGRANYTLSGRPGPFLRVRFAGPATVPWASVAGRAVPALREGENTWLIPLGDRRARQATIAWHARPPVGGMRGRIGLPEVDPGGVPTLISVTVPGPSGGLRTSGGLERLDRTGWEAARMDQLTGRLVALLTDFDRGSRSDRDAALADLVEFEILSRSFERARAEGTAVSAPALSLARAARIAIEEASQTVGLDDLLEEARSAVGLVPPKAEPGDPGPVDPAEPFRIRRIGPTSYFRGDVGKSGRPSFIDWEPETPPGSWRRVEPWSILAVGFLSALGLGRIASRPFRPHGWPGKAALSAASMATLALEPFGMAALVASFFVGRSSDGNDRA